MKHAVHNNCLKRLRRIEGQVRGIARMIEQERYCIDILTQIRAAQAALRRVEDEVLKDHMAHCVEGAIARPISAPGSPN
jgi:DNA-binding FrmR family transcriptional regulator